ncbi:hypothetical protein SISSUDRAFT_1062148 [Sistotremastrum suecicum HHB10207 ss-3]|uniref:DUF6533 domain-containing protein n=1 Tax=Sistotremastrum suecicum HHB10207 ss-3 TaxID=1314776 RepID=A0A166D7H6_9AGAM|nr:hypothetical protein SISSUDRAFT_1062148 [Sistotremastrum suecicum HHB10207 ss-3]
MTPGNLNQNLINAYEQYTVAEQTKVAALAVLLYDWMLTFDREVKYFWKLEFSIPRILYFTSRYLPIIAELLNVVGYAISTSALSTVRHQKLLLPASDDESRCQYWLGSWTSGTHTAEIFIIQMILSYRIYAVYECNRRLLIYLSILLLCTSTAATATLSMQVQATKGTLTNEPAPGIYICDVTAKLKFIWAYWIPILIFESVVFALMAHKALNQWGVRLLQPKASPSIGEKMVAILFYDSFIYFVSVLVVFTTLTFLFRYTSENVFNTAHGPSFAIISVLANRMLLNLPATYELAHRDECNVPTLQTMKFERPDEPMHCH